MDSMSLSRGRARISKALSASRALLAFSQDVQYQPEFLYIVPAITGLAKPVADTPRIVEGSRSIRSLIATKPLIALGEFTGLAPQVERTKTSRRSGHARRSDLARIARAPLFRLTLRGGLLLFERV